jgi:(1->4)-alpha-D-glucan 1-alpha-D-glucosylmutase
MFAKDRQPAPSRAHQYMIYQALLGAWPSARIDDTFVERITAYAIKAAREGKVATSWAAPDTAYEAALQGFVKAILEPAGNADFLNSFSELAQRVALIGALNSLSQLALKMMLPGVPDIYQGSEFWDLSLVDPDNRRPVAFDDRLQTLALLEDNPPWQELCADWRSGRIKLALMRTLLTLRRQRPLHFAQGQYIGLSVTGPDADKVIAFARIHRRACIVIAARRHFRNDIGDGIAWPRSVHCNASIDLPARPAFRDLLDPAAPDELRGQTHATRLFGRLPVAVLTSA